MAQRRRQRKGPLVGHYIPAGEPIDFKAEPVALSEVEILHVLLRKSFQRKEREARAELRKNLRMPLIFASLGVVAYLLEGVYSLLKMFLH